MGQNGRAIQDPGGIARGEEPRMGTWDNVRDGRKKTVVDSLRMFTPCFLEPMTMVLYMRWWLEIKLVMSRL